MGLDYLQCVCFVQPDGKTDRLKQLVDAMNLIYRDTPKLNVSSELEYLDKLEEKGWPKSASYQYINSSHDWIGRLLIHLGIDIYSVKVERTQFNLRCFVAHHCLIESGEPRLEVEAVAGHIGFSAWAFIASYFDLTFYLVCRNTTHDIYVNTDTERRYFASQYYVKWRVDNIMTESGPLNSVRELLDWIDYNDLSNVKEDLLGQHAGNLYRSFQWNSALLQSLTIDKVKQIYGEQLKIHDYQDLGTEYQKIFSQDCNTVYGCDKPPFHYSKTKRFDLPNF